MLKGLAIAGWITFAVEWMVVILVVTSLLGQERRVEADAAPQRVAATPRTPARTPAAVQTPAPRTVTPTRVTPSRPAVGVAGSAGANVLGMTLSPGHTVVLLDAVEQSGPWLSRAKAKLITGLSQSGPAGATFSVAVINNNSGRSLTNRRLTYGPAAAGPLRTALTPLQIKGTKGLGTGLDTATKLGADQVIFITSRSTKWGPAVPFLQSKLNANGKRVRLDVVQVNNQAVAELRAFVTGANKGQYRVVAPGSI